MLRWLAACVGSQQPLAVSVENVHVDAPAGFVPLAQNDLGALAEAAQAAAPDQVHVLAAARHPAGPTAGVVQVQRSVERDAARYGPTVGAALEALEADLHARLSEDALGAFTAVARDGGREVCWTAGTVQSCAHALVTPDRALVVRSVTCSAADPAVCAPIVATRRLSAEPALALDAALPTAGLPGVAAGAVWGVTLGATRAAFQVACTAAGLAVDGYDWAVEPAVVKEWVDAGRASRCSGVPAPPAGLGRVVGASAVFDADRLVGLTVYLDHAPEAVEAVVAAAYPQSFAGADQILHVVDSEASGDALLSVTVMESSAPGARSMLTFLTRAGADR